MLIGESLGTRRDDGAWARFHDVIDLGCRVFKGPEESPLATAIDRQSVISAHHAPEAVGLAAEKRVKGRKRRPICDRLGLMMRIKVQFVRVQNRGGATLMFGRIAARFLSVECTFVWVKIDRRLTKDFERFAATAQPLS